MPSICDVIVSQVSVENENSISLGGTIILLALFAQKKNFFGQIRGEEHDHWEDPGLVLVR